MAIGSDVAGANNRDKRVLLNGQVPRVTTTLRALRSHAKIFDIDQAYLERKKVLISRRNKRSSSKVCAFGQKVIPFWEEAPSQAKQACEDFLVAVAELIEGELSTEELHESAIVVYNILRTPNTNSATEKSQKRNELLKSFRHISESVSIEKIAELAHKINELASSYPSNASSSPWLGRSPDEGEFGMGLDFHPPSFEDDFTDSEVLSEIQDIYLPKSGLEDVVGMNDSTREFGDVSKDLSGSNDESVILRWFKDLCDDVTVSGASQFSGDELAMALIRVMNSSDRTSDEIAGEIFDLIGEIQFDQIQKILQHRKDIIDAVHKGLTALKNDTNGGSQQPRMPSYGTQVSVQTSSDRNIEKIRRREDKKNFRRGFGHYGESELEKIVGVSGFSALVDASERSDRFLQSLANQSNESSGLTTALPQGTVRKIFKGYEEVRVPATLTAPMKPGEQLVKIAELDEFAQTAFEGYQTLNRIQSRIFKTAYNTNGNILVCAPTGAGKTNIAMIAVLREIGQNFKNGVLQKNNFKVVYVAPMKALAAEVARAFSQRLAPLNVLVRELTGDMQPSKQELQDTQMIVTTPEKWDVITRKSSDGELAVLVKLLIIDEVHLLNDDRGPVIEALVARTLRQVESSQSMIRIVGLSATLPNYLEVAKFLRVNPDSGLFFFDSSYRPVPLTQQYIGVTETNFVGRNNAMNEICYSKVSESVRLGYQAMVFVHSRKDTVKTGRILAEMAQRHGELGLFTSEDLPQFTLSKKEVAKSRNRELVELFQSGFGIHHAGMLRSDRNLTERMFSNGLIKVLVCTATLAWGVNLPAHTVIIKGTQLYDPKAGGWRELGMLDVMQIFGRAGRPQFDKSGEGIIITTHDKLAYYLRLLTHQLPIESQFVSSLKDNLNAEVVLGTVTNIKEALAWLGYTYLFVRMPSNPLAYGMSWEEVTSDPSLIARRKALIIDAARALDKAKMIRFDEKSGNLYITDLGRVASHFYIHYTSVETYNEMLKRHMNESELFHMVAHSSEFENIMVREEEQQELETLLRSYCPLEVRGGPEDKISKINILMQVFISRGLLEGFSLIADSAYITDSLGRIMRALFEICVHRGWCSMTALLLEYCKAVDRRIWPHQHPLRQFEGELSQEVLYKLEDRNAELERLYDMEEREIGQLLRHPHAGKLTKQCLQYFLRLHISANVSPITRTVLQVSLTITPDFVWKERWHGTSQRWWIWVEDSDNEHIYHHENLLLTKKILKEGSQTVTFTIPIFEPLPPQYYIRVVSDSWLHAEALHTVSFQRLILPELHPPHTELLDLRPLPVTALNNEIYQSLYKFSHFNPIQTQAFHTLYCTDNNVLLGAPTGSGKTISSELAMLRLFNTRPDMKVVYIAPLKALVKERLEDWKRGLVKTLNKHMVELTGDFTPDMKALLLADIIVSTPEKWDGISRNWHNRSYVMKVGLVIIDEIHLLGGDRGPILEVIVSRMRYISSQTEQLVRFVGLSTALANAQDLGSWLGISEIGLYNFKPSVRPVPLEVHIQGYPGKFYCPRMNSMNKPAYASIMTHSPLKPVLIFVSSRRQTRLTALALIQFAIADDRPRQFVHMSEDDLEMFLYQVTDPNLKHTLQFGIGLHHAGLNNKDRTLVEELFLNNKIQVLVSTSTLAWGVNLPAHLVVIKGTEFFDGKSKRYVDFPLTDVLQMMGRAGRPQFDQYGKAVILVHDSKKSFYKKFLYEPFPVESSLHQQLHDHFNAEIVAGTITTKQDAIAYLTWTYFFRRLVMNPSYYNLEDTTSSTINAYLSSLVKDTLLRLEDAGCIKVKEDNSIEPLFLGTIASQYYLSYTTVELFNKHIGPNTPIEVLLDVLANATEYDELPVRHNEEKLNEILAKDVRVHVDMRFLDDPHVKTNLLLQAHFSRMDLPIVDYVTDTKSVLDQGIRIIQALVDMAANGGWLKSTLNAMHLLQMVMQGMWYDEDNLLRMLPNMNDTVMDSLRRCNTGDLRTLMDTKMDMINQILAPLLSSSQLEEVAQVLKRLPRMQTEWRFQRRNNSQEEDLQILEVEIKRFSSNRKNASAFTPRYPKVKDEGWWLVLGDPASNELYALKRVMLVEKLNTNLRLPSSFGSNLEGVYLYLISDCYIGLDQEYPLQAVRK